MTDYAVYQSFAVDSSGNTISGASIEVRSETTSNLVALFSGRTGGAKSNPFTADSDGYFVFYTVGDFLKVRVYTGPSGAPTSERIFRYVAVGLATGYDVNTLARALPDGTVSAPGAAFASSPTTGVYSPGTNIWAVSTAGVEQLRIDAAGLVGVGAAASGANIRLGKSLVSSVPIGVNNNGTVQSGVSTATYLQIVGSTQATAFTLTGLIYNYATQGTIGAGSSVTSQYGYYAESTLTGATNNFGFYGNIAAASNRWNFYANGTARNYMGGALSIGATTDPGTNGLFVAGPTNITSTAALALQVGNTANPAFQVDASTGSQVAGCKIIGAVTGGTVALVAIDSGANTNVTINAKGTGTIGIGGVSTGNVTIGGGGGSVLVPTVANIASGTATPAGGSTAARLLFGTTAGFGIYYGSGVPTVSAAAGSLYIRTDNAGANLRLYSNTTGSTVWAAITSA